MAASWDELNAKYGASSTPPATAGGGDAWAELNAKYSAPQASSDPVKVSRPETKQKDVGVMDRVRAGMAGVNKGFFSDLAGLPVDTMANVVDLAKAGYGTAVTAAGRPDLAPNIDSDRSGVVGSSAWIAKQINAGTQAAGLPSPIDNLNPQDPISRIAHTGGRFAGASVVPSAKAAIGPIQQVQNAAMGTVSGLAAGSVGEVAPEYAGAAGMLPSASAMGANKLVRLLARGGEPGRINMQQRIHDLEQAGVTTPSAGLATGNRLLQGVENLLSLTPGSMGVIGENRLTALAGLQSRAEGLRSKVSPTYGASEAGAGIQADLKGAFKDRVSNTYGLLNDRVEQAIGADTPIMVNNSLASIARMTAPVQGAEATSSNFINSRIAKIGKDLKTDAGGKPATSTPSIVLGPDGNPAFALTTPATNPQGVPLSAVKNVRTRIGQEAASSEIMGTPQQGEYKQIYGAMSQDMKVGVALADLLNGTKGSQALERANTYYSNAMKRAEAMGNLAGRSTPEGAYNSLASSLNSGPTTFSRVRNAVSTDTRQKVVATIIDDMGRATPGQQNAQGSEWSPKTFITNYNRIDPAARRELFKRLPGGEQYAVNLETIAKAADMVNQGGKVMANPSGTAAALANRGTLSALTVGAFIYPMAAATAAGSLVSANAFARLFTNPSFVNWLAKTPTVRPEDMRVHAQRLLQAAEASKDAQFRDDAGAYLQAVQQGMQSGQ